MGGGGQLDGNFLSGSLPHKFIILIVTSFICLWSKFFSLSRHYYSYSYCCCCCCE